MQKMNLLKKKIKEGLKDTLKKWTDKNVKMVSKKVMERSKKEIYSVDPFQLLWTDRNKLGKVQVQGKSSKSWLVWEHTTPLNEFYKTLTECKSEKDVENSMKKYSGVCWISRDEDNALNAKKYRSRRPGGWQKCYEECSIEIVKLI
jgi:hypothetical protein